MSLSKAITPYLNKLELAGKRRKSLIRKETSPLFKKKDEIRDWLEKHRDEIIAEKLVVFFADECHLLWGDICGYVWGKKQERIEIPIINERERQTYYGAVNLYTQECVIQRASAGNSEATVAFLKYLQGKNEDKQIAIIWDGASYHRSQEVKDYLAHTNHALDESSWKITCIRFAPNDPKQNPIEDIWLQAKRFIRKFYHLCKSFATVKFFFEFITHRQIFNFPKLFIYGFFSRLI